MSWLTWLLLILITIIPAGLYLTFELLNRKKPKKERRKDQCEKIPYKD